MASEGDKTFGKIALDKNFINLEEFQKALSRLEMLEQQQKVSTLDRVLAELGYLDEYQIYQLQEVQKRRIIICPQCQNKYNVYTGIPGSTMNCKRCNTVLQVPYPPTPPSRTPQPKRATPPPEMAQDRGKEFGNAPDVDVKKLSGEEIQGYHFREMIGEGGMGVVYKASKRILNRPVAIKILLPELAKKDEYRKRFLREINVAAQLDHTNITRVHDIIEQGESFLGYVMEFIDGENLEKILKRDGPLSYEKCLDYMIQIARALVELEKKKITHRDIKPENIMITQDGVAKLTDLGLAKNTGDAQTALTVSGITMGTPWFMSPEQIEDAREADIRSDIYSFGATFYRLLSGKLPFEGKNYTEVFKAVFATEAVPIENLVPKLPPKFCAFLKRMMAKKRNERVQTAHDVMEGLISIRDDKPIIEKLFAIGEDLFKKKKKIEG